MAKILNGEEYRGLIAKHYPVVIGGYSGQGYTDLEAVRQNLIQILRYLACEHGRHLLIVSGGTKAGIGIVYEIAKDLKLATLGIVSDQVEPEAVSIYCDYIFLVPDPSGSWEVKSAEGDSYLVETARKGEMLYFGGGKVALNEVLEAKAKGIAVSVFSSFMPGVAS